MSSADSADEASTPRRVAIACQGGGSHTAFTAGVLGRLLLAEETARYPVTGLSGTSGGAVCALLAWYGLLENDPDGPADRAGRARAARLLEQFWTDNSAAGPWERLANAGLMWASTLQDHGLLPVISPYDTPVSVTALEEFRGLLQRQVDFERIQVDTAGRHPVLLIGAVDVLSGEFRTFQSRRDRITADAVLASAAIPNLFRAVQVDGRTYWDGLFSQNPPVRELVDTAPDELWVIQINPTQQDNEPTSVIDIADRRNELAGNLSLHQEVRFIEKIDQMLADGRLIPGDRYKQIVVRIIELPRTPLTERFGSASKLNRDPEFLRGLMALGRRQADEFLAALAFERAWAGGDPDTMLASFTDDAEVVSTAPFPLRGAFRGPEQVRRFVEEHLCGSLQVDSTHKQVARDRVTWRVRARDGDSGAALEGRAEARFRDGKVAALWLGG
ncbi:patatin-like phospholipase family protein [Pseudonocardia bannensis]|uniref:SnoaL-like domain-containing protein n=1 Tax=Pseudonocardia bannensis TaxID=630973 RepID=A0A848DGG4_9PSEU|nr:patatin-like phospholipase family protein [Pseudonocardia bannensis]NMH91762.1 SnoaL-like domain-containing protein [Pseudonocardia bannensis]